MVAVFNIVNRYQRIGLHAHFPNHGSSRSSDDGFTLIEILVAIALLAIGALGALGGLTKSAKNINSQSEIASATFLANEFISRLDSNMNTVNQNVYLNASFVTIPVVQACRFVGCNAEATARQDLHEWLSSASRQLKTPRIQLLEQNGTVRLSLAWNSSAEPIKASECSLVLADSESCIVRIRKIL